MKYKVIFIGNSIVAGYPWSKSKSFPSILRKTWEDNTVGLDVINKGVNGDTTSGIAARFKTDVLDHNPDMVFFLTGTNDFIYRDSTVSEAFANLEELAEKTCAAGGVPVYITPVPVDAGKAECMWLAGCGISYDAVNRDLEELSALMAGSGRLFVDMNSLFRKYADTIGDPDLVYLDGLHPMPDGHEFMAAEIIRFMKENMAGLGLK